MNYYPFHVGDYSAHTTHLEPMEDLAYRRLLDIYYLREGPLPADIQATAKLVRMRSMAADVESVLREFFYLSDEGWRHTRCDAEIARMQDKQAKARQSAQASVNARKASADKAAADAQQSLGQGQADAKLPTPTPTPKKKREAAPLVTVEELVAAGMTEQTAEAYIFHRKTKKAPLTPVAWRGIKSEIDRAGWSTEDAAIKAMNRNWIGMEAEWLMKDKPLNGHDFAGPNCAN